MKIILLWQQSLLALALITSIALASLISKTTLVGRLQPSENFPLLQGIDFINVKV